MKVTVDPFRPIYPTPAALITSVAPDGRPNIITLGEVYNLSLRTPTVVGIGIHKARYSHALISQTREYVVNLPAVGLVEQVDHCGSCSGRDVDKFAAFGLTPLPASQVKPPLIAECPVNVECVLKDVIDMGDHDTFVGEVVAVHADQELLDEKGRVRLGSLDALCFLACYGARGEYWSLGAKVGEMGFARRREPR
jgi:flavin reductase (DIM6/NTAB) family NADH-FMN oxidoreductase RutF